MDRRNGYYVHISNKEYLGLTSDEDRTVMQILSRPSHLLRNTTKAVLLYHENTFYLSHCLHRYFFIV